MSDDYDLDFPMSYYLDEVGDVLTNPDEDEWPRIDSLWFDRDDD